MVCFLFHSVIWTSVQSTYVSFPSGILLDLFSDRMFRLLVFHNAIGNYQIQALSNIYINPGRMIRFVYGLYTGRRNMDRTIIKIEPYTASYGSILMIVRSIFLRPVYRPYRSTWAVSKPKIQSRTSSQLENPASNLKFKSESNTSSQT